VKGPQWGGLGNRKSNDEVFKRRDTVRGVKEVLGEQRTNKNRKVLGGAGSHVKKIPAQAVTKRTTKETKFREEAALTRRRSAANFETVIGSPGSETRFFQGKNWGKKPIQGGVHMARARKPQMTFRKRDREGTEGPITRMADEKRNWKKENQKGLKRISS